MWCRSGDHTTLRASESQWKPYCGPRIPPKSCASRTSRHAMPANADQPVALRRDGLMVSWLPPADPMRTSLRIGLPLIQILFSVLPQHCGPSHSFFCALYNVFIHNLFICLKPSSSRLGCHRTSSTSKRLCLLFNHSLLVLFPFLPFASSPRAKIQNPLPRPLTGSMLRTCSKQDGRLLWCLQAVSAYWVSVRLPPSHTPPALLCSP
jgi:hypothetical protein